VSQQKEASNLFVTVFADKKIFPGFCDNACACSQNFANQVNINLSATKSVDVVKVVNEGFETRQIFKISFSRRAGCTDDSNKIRFIIVLVISVLKIFKICL